MVAKPPQTTKKSNSLRITNVCKFVTHHFLFHQFLPRDQTYFQIFVHKLGRMAFRTEPGEIFK